MTWETLFHLYPRSGEWTRSITDGCIRFQRKSVMALDQSVFYLWRSRKSLFLTSWFLLQSLLSFGSKKRDYYHYEQTNRFLTNGCYFSSWSSSSNEVETTRETKFWPSKFYLCWFFVIVFRFKADRLTKPLWILPLLWPFLGSPFPILRPCTVVATISFIRTRRTKAPCHYHLLPTVLR